jgi:hypothetical protein
MLLEDTRSYADQVRAVRQMAERANRTLTDEETATIHFALSTYRIVLQRDLQTHFNNDPRWSNEDRMFLEDMIEKVDALLRKFPSP